LFLDEQQPAFPLPLTNGPAEPPQRVAKLQMKIGGGQRGARTTARYSLTRKWAGADG
jgi:hypothetical protein